MSAAEDRADVWTLRKLLTWTSSHFEKKGIDSPRLTAEILLAHLLKLNRVQLYIQLDKPLSKPELATFRALIERRIAGEPTQYLTGYKDFYNRRFTVDARVLIPRPETELLVDAVLRHLPKAQPAQVLDLCAGSGCVGLSIAGERPQVSVTATELSPDAAAVARLNAEQLKLPLTLLEGDLFSPLPQGALFDVIVSNPPYVRSAEIAKLQTEVQKEPKTALDGGTDGLDLIRRIVDTAPTSLRAGGLLALEIGDEQGHAVLRLLTQAGYGDARIEKDLARLDRLALGTRPAAS
ncbi:MAG: peptide chain release factor N(5)-glutamine methyltransferase [Myxococcaceae bacterium]